MIPQSTDLTLYCYPQTKACVGLKTGCLDTTRISLTKATLNRCKACRLVATMRNPDRKLYSYIANHEDTVA